ncbi:zinc metallopeptidase [Anaerosphaera multitolerans]|uniref:Zinc metallopeptidase n=1 Tax=Anaerosphaera multitolerans TaxID=2487351 RepID=A0A437S6X9_9FIRM|nr:zinc metallopeptidase [Anaerosphaera multitolerans]RVU54762.1 zinc metallopeptidase [Anaerosphaera multitolerans]
MFSYGIYNYQYLIYILPGLILSLYAQSKIKSAYEKYKKVDSGTGLTGAEVARIIMDRNGLRDIEILETKGVLSDNYNPSNKTLNLSREVYYGRSVASLSIAAHEVGHALQDATEYFPLKIRSFLVPAATIGSNLSFFFIILGLFSSVFFVKLGVALFALAVLFQIVTLPVEFNASSRAEDELSNSILAPEMMVGTKKVLSAAALTYVAATLVAVLELLRLLSIVQDRRN